MSEPAPSEAKELALVGKVEFKIALADSDAKLETLLNTFLPALLLKLRSPHASVRDKVVTICKHLFQRVGQIRLPVAALLTQFKENPSFPLLQQFDLTYARKGLHLLSGAELRAVVPQIAKGIDQVRNSTTGPLLSRLINTLLVVLCRLELPARGSKEEEEFVAQCKLGPEDQRLLACLFTKLMLFLPSDAPQPGVDAATHGLLMAESLKDPWDPLAKDGLYIMDCRQRALWFLSTNVFAGCHTRVAAYLCAAADGNAALSEAAKDLLKRVVADVDLEDRRLVNTIYRTYVGTDEENLEAGSIPKPAVQIQLLNFLGRCKASTAYPTMVSFIVENTLLKKSNAADPVAARRRVDRGTETNRLRAAVFGFLTFFARNASQEQLNTIASSLLARLRTFIEEQGWPEPGPEEDVATRRTAYEVIGILARADKKADLDLLMWLFRSLCDDPSGRDTTSIIGDALSALISVFSNPTTVVRDSDLINVLLNENPGFYHDDETMSRTSDNAFLRSRLSNARYLAVRFANQCLPFESVPARLLNLRILTGYDGEGQEVLEEAKHGLDPHWFKSRDLHPADGQVRQPISFPSYTDIIGEAITWLPLKQNAGRMAPVAKFAYLLLLQESFQRHNVGVTIDVSWERRLLTAIEDEMDAQDALAEYLKPTNMDESKVQSLLQLRNICLYSLDPEQFKRFPEAKDILIRLFKIADSGPDEVNIFSSNEKVLPELNRALFSHNKNLRIFAAETFGLSPGMHTSIEAQELVESCSEFVRNWNSTTSGSTSYGWKVDGSILLLANHWSRVNRDHTDERRESFVETVEEILKDSRDTDLLETCCYAISKISIFLSAGLEKRGTFDLVLETAKKGNERAIVALGHIAMHIHAEPADDFAKTLESFRSLHEIREIETQFSVGEAISCFAAGWASKSMISLRERSLEHPIDGVVDSRSISTIMEAVLKDTKNTKPALKKASAIWLLCLVQYCGHLEEMKEYLTQSQTAFLHCLSDRNELVQEAASRGLGIVYEMGDRNLKDDLVRNLVKAFSESKSQLSGNVTEDTELFDEGMLRNRDGSIKTYGDILNLAQEAGDSTLVYKYMAIAANNAMWSSRAAFGKFGLSSVLSSSSVDGYLAENPKLYPKLFRYRFDPVENVRRAMNDIWNALVPDTSATLEKYFDPIMEDLLDNILSGKEWRVRQACCAAIADLIQSKPFEKYEKYLGQIWANCFKVLDDIKDSVRVAAAGLSRTLTGIATRSLESGVSSKSEAMLNDVLPFLLSTSGLGSSAKEVQIFSITALLDIVKKANGKVLRPHIPLLVEKILGLLTSLEPQEINYIHLNADKYNLTEQKIDDMRLNAIRSSPLMDAIERCLDLLDSETMERLVPSLESVMRSAVGLPSKVGIGRVLVSLSTRHRNVFGPSADKFLVLLQKYVLDRNETVSTSYAVAAGYVARVASDDQILALFKFCRNLYLTSDDERKSTTSGDIIHAVAKHAPDRFKGIASDILPFVFFAKHDSVASVKEEYQKAWNETVGGSRSVLLYLKEIVGLASEHLESQKWILKHTASRAVADVVQSVIQTNSTITPAQAELIYPALKKALAVKMWDGKKDVLASFVAFVEKSRDFWREKPDLQKEITQIATREAGRLSLQYRPAALTALGKIAGLQNDAALSKTALTKADGIVKTLLTSADDMDVDDEDESVVQGPLRDETLTCAIVAMGDAFNEAVFRSPDAASLTTQYLATVHFASSEPSNPILTALATSLDRFVAALPTDPAPLFGTDQDAVLTGITAVLFDTEPAHEALRGKRAGQVKSLAEKRWVGANAVIRKRLPEMVEGEISPVIRKTLEAAMELVKQ